MSQFGERDRLRWAPVSDFARPQLREFERRSWPFWRSTVNLGQRSCALCDGLIRDAGSAVAASSKRASATNNLTAQPSLLGEQR